MAISSPPPTMTKLPQKKHETSILYFYLLTDWLLGATIGNYGHSVMDLQCL